MFTMIVNPVAGRGRAQRAADRLKKALAQRDAAFEIAYSEYPGHTVELARACAQSGDARVLCVGGDGTVFEAANGLLGSDTALGVIPAGTGNDFARTLGLPKDPVLAMDALLAAPVRAVNVCHLNDRIFLNVCGAGFDAAVVTASERAKRFCGGMLPYLYGVLHALFTYAPQHFTLEIGGETGEKIQRALLMVSVANGQYIGGGMHVAPMARLDDDLLDLIMISAMPRWRIPLLLPRFIDGSFIKLKKVAEHRRCREVRIASPGMCMQMDGEVASVEEALLRVGNQRLLLLMPEAGVKP
jgi:YegS/Rv2252/BmrU family lipid kinase